MAVNDFYQQISVVDGPEPIVIPTDIAGVTDANDEAVKRLIMAAQRTIDGPSGWLQRAIGPQTLELTMSDFCGRNFLLPCPPVIEIVSIKYLDDDEAEQTIDDANYRLAGNRVWFGSDYSFPSIACAPDAVRIQYRVGYNGGASGEPVDTGPVPDEAKQAVIFMVQNMKSLAAENLYLRAEEVEGVGRDEYTLTEQATNIVDKICKSLLQGLRVFA